MEHIVDTYISIENATSSIIKFIEDEDVYGYIDTNDALSKPLNDLFDSLKDELFLYVEYPYIDRLYRDSYYTYFSSKHKRYFRDCIRVSLFDKEVNKTHFRSLEYKSYLQNSYLG